jgi:uncharacterized membrane protein
MNENNENLNTQPVQPEVPVAPVEPVAPAAPQEPVAPVAPAVPVEPVAPAEQVAPVTPAEPVQPVAPQPEAQPVQPAAQATSQTNGGQTTTDNNDILYGVLSYLGFLSLIVLFVIKPQSDFAQFHAKQGSNLFVIELVVNVFGGVIRWALSLSGIPFVGRLVGLVGTAVWILSIIGLVYAAQGKKYELPVISNIKIFK